MPETDEQQHCATCGHAKFLHKTLGGECEACDDPTILISNKCPGFKGEHEA